MTRYTPPKRIKKKKGTARFLPVLGLTMALLLAFVAYTIAPPLISFGEEKSDKVQTQFDQFRNQYERGELYLHIIVAGVLWLFMLGLSAFIVAAFIGEDPNKEAFLYMRPKHAKQGQELARDALIAAVVGLFVCGFVLEPYAIFRAREAKKVLAPGDPGRQKAGIAEFIGWLCVLLYVLSFLAFAYLYSVTDTFSNGLY